MPEVNTARGAIDANDLGVTLMHEHVFIMTTEVMQNYPESWGDDEAREADALAACCGTGAGHHTTAGSGASVTALSNGGAVRRYSQRRNATRHGDSTSA